MQRRRDIRTKTHVLHVRHVALCVRRHLGLYTLSSDGKLDVISAPNHILCVYHDHSEGLLANFGGIDEAEFDIRWTSGPIRIGHLNGEDLICEFGTVGTVQESFGESCLLWFG